MRRIVVMNTKGGCGKTTIATNLASLYACKGFKTALLDYDPQGSSTHWLSLRNKESPAIHGVFAARPATGVTYSWQIRVPVDTQRIIQDTPASLDRLDLKERVRGADAILIPVLPSPIDAHATANFIRDLHLVAKLRSTRTRIGIIPNRTRETTLAFQALQRFLDSLSIPIVTQLHDSQLYVQAAECGAGVHELTNLRTQHHVPAWRRLYEWLERVPETSLA
ncbi:MAG TPA: ParA family protein [Gammaproteobacteria bacterium]|nr:ParA family protein [Gammaproteobacteria bacterium]